MAVNLSRFTIRTRLYGGFGLVIVLVIGLAAFGAQRLLEVGANVEAMSVDAEHLARSHEVVEQVQTIRRAALRYFVDADKDSLTQLGAAMNEAQQLLKSSIGEATSEQRANIYRGISENLQEFSTLAQSMVAMRDVVTAQLVKVTTIGNQIIAAMPTVMQHAEVGQDISVVLAAADVRRSILEMRVAAWRFVVTLNQQTAAEFKPAHDAVHAALTHLNRVADADTGALIEPLGKQVDDYADNFQLLQSTLFANHALYYDQMTPQIIKLQASLNDVSTTLTTRFKATKSRSDDTIASSTWLQMIVAAISVLLGVAAALICGRSIIKPITGMTQAMHRLADGETATEIPSLDARDEIGEMAKAVEVFKANMIRNAELAGEQAGEQSRKEQRQRTVDGFIGEFDQSVGTMLQMLASSATEMESAAQSMAGTAGRTNEQASAMAAAAEQASANVQTMAAATEEMAASASEISHQVSRSAQITARAVESARHTDHQVQSLSEAAKRIEDVVAIINGIAAQTNLLALNATIEAARAGDAGKGFAVVASEVKALAGQTGKATEEIGAQVQAIQAATREAVEAIKAISATINEVNDISTTIAAAMEEQGATTNEMTRNTQQAAQGTQDVSTTIAEVSQGANATGAAASQVLAAASELGRQAATLRTGVDGFLTRIRAA
jgi:methyl-accepting chemotaxis protein